MADTRLWHGGAAGLHVGDLITPRAAEDARHLVDGCPVCEARRNGEPLPDDDLDPTLVYVTTSRDYAKLYAAGYPRGDLYTVDVVGELTPSPDPVPSWGVEAATVRGVYERCVTMTPRRALALARRIA